MSKALCDPKHIGMTTNKIVDPYWSFEDIHPGYSFKRLFSGLKLFNPFAIFPSFSNFLKFFSLALIIALVIGVSGLLLYAKFKENTAINNLLNKVTNMGATSDGSSLLLPPVPTVPTVPDGNAPPIVIAEGTNTTNVDNIANETTEDTFDYFSWAQKPSSYSKGKRYTIVWGVTLKTAAKEIYGKEIFWPYLYWYNRTTLTSPDQLVPLEDKMHIPPSVKEVSLGRLYFELFKMYKAKGIHSRTLLQTARYYDAQYVKNNL